MADDGKLTKALHRKMLSFASSRLGLIACFLGALSFVFHSIQLGLGNGLALSPEVHQDAGRRTIGGMNTHANSYMGYAPIDIVYTWVNGSDPVWLKEKDLWAQLWGVGSNATAAATASEGMGAASGSHGDPSASSSNSSSISLETAGNDTDDRGSSNRYRDSEELRYSLRSVIKYAPWVRRIYVVTANQVPWWLDTSHPQLHMVSHEEIFPNRSHLPVFSSPAIEAHLHRIPGLSKHFIYFNDDVMLGAPTAPEDFVSVQGRQKLVMAWDVPKCAPGCVDSWIGDGYCDKACNNTACGFDYPDCINGTNTRRGSRAHGMQPQCSKGCPDSWLGDKTCDLRCQVEACAFDVGDCGIYQVVQHFPGSTVSADALRFYHHKTNTKGESAIKDFSTTTGVDVDNPSNGRGGPLELVVTHGTPAVYMNLTMLAATLGEPKGLGQLSNGTSRFEFNDVVHSDSSLVHSASLVKLHSMLVVVLFAEQDNAPDPPQMPHDIKFRLSGFDKESERNFSANFRVRVVERAVVHLPLPTGMSSVAGHVGQCGSLIDGTQNTANLLGWDNLRILDVPFQDTSATDTTGGDESSKEEKKREGVVVVADKLKDLAMMNPTMQNLYTAPLSLLSIRTTTYWRNPDTKSNVAVAGDEITETLTKRLCDNLVVYDSEGLHTNDSACEETSTLVSISESPWYQVLDSHQVRHEGLMLATVAERQRSLAASHIAVLLEIPVLWQSLTNSQWVRSKFEVLSGNESVLCATVAFKWGGHLTMEPKLGLKLEESLNASISSNGTQSNDTATTDVDSSVGRRLIHSVHSVAPGLDRREVLKTQVETIFRRQLQAAMDRVPSSAISRRRLGDTYSDSLVHVNRLFNKKFGSEARKVPAHVPHMINRVIMTELQKQWMSEWERTSRNKFRSGDDMQYAFSYYHYLINRARVLDDWADGSEVRAGVGMEVPTPRKPTPPGQNGTVALELFLGSEIDADGDGFINDNEFRSLACLVAGKPPCTRAAEILRNCSSLAENITSVVNIVKGLAQMTTSKLLPRVGDVLACPAAVEGIRIHLEGVFVAHTIAKNGADEVAFEMIDDNATHSIHQLDSIRARRSKFICINDNMRNPPPELVTALDQFFTAMYPIPSAFELPPGVRNPSLYTDELRKIQWNRVLPAPDAIPAWLHQVLILILSSLIVMAYLYASVK